MVAISTLWCLPSSFHFQELARVQNALGGQAKFYYMEVQDESAQPIPGTEGWEAIFPDLSQYPTTYYFKRGRLINKTTILGDIEGAAAALCPVRGCGEGGAAPLTVGVVIIVLLIVIAALWRGKKAG